MQKQLRIYISGQITGLEIKTAESYFESVENELSKAGHIPVNPCKILPFHPDHTWHDYMADDIKALLYCDAIFMLENWTNSKGAKIEHSIAQGLGLQIFYSKNHNFF